MKRRLISVFILFTVLFAVASARQQTPVQQAAAPSQSSLPDLYPLFLQKESLGDYLGFLLALRRDEAAYRADVRQRATFLQVMSVIESQVGDFAQAQRYFDEFRRSQSGPEKDVDRAPFDGYELRNAAETVSEIAGSQQVIMINEEHDTPMHRAFTTRLLPLLYAKGFRYFAAETLDEADADLQKRGYPTHKTGFYTADPVYGDMIRTAIRLGFKIVPYEYIPRGCQNPPDNPDHCQDVRERGQAQNLYDRILKDDPKAKVFVHVGRGHHQEVNVGNWALMGWHFKEITKIDPFTIDQLHMSERSAPEFESPLYRYAVGKWHITEPSVFRSKEGKLWGQLGNDLTIIHPRTRYEQGRPVWLQLGGARKPIAIYGDVVRRVARPFIVATGGPFIVQAFFDGEGDDAIPVDQMIVNDPKDAPVLVLPNGRFRVLAKDAAGRVVASTALATK